MGETDTGLKDAVRRKGSLLQTIKAVGWSFFGVRKSREFEKDVTTITLSYTFFEVGGKVPAAPKGGGV